MSTCSGGFQINFSAIRAFNAILQINYLLTLNYKRHHSEIPKNADCLLRWDEKNITRLVTIDKFITFISSMSLVQP